MKLVGTENSVFEPISPSRRFDNLSPTSGPQCGGRRKVGGEDLNTSTGLHKTSPDRNFGPRGQRGGALSFSLCHPEPEANEFAEVRVTRSGQILRSAQDDIHSSHAQ